MAGGDFDDKAVEGERNDASETLKEDVAGSRPRRRSQKVFPDDHKEKAKQLAETMWEKAWKDGVELEYKLPGSIYVSPFLWLVDAIKEHKKRRHCVSFVFWVILFVVPQLIVLLINDVIQIGFIYYLNDFSEEEGGCLGEQSFELVVMGLGLFVCAMIDEFEETLEMLIWTRFTEEWDEWAKIAFVTSMIIPKFGIAVLLLISGMKFVAASKSDVELVLNCLAMKFVVEIDDLLFKALTPKLFREPIEKLTVVRVKGECTILIDSLLLPWVKLALWPVFVKVSIDGLQCAH